MHRFFWVFCIGLLLVVGCYKAEPELVIGGVQSSYRPVAVQPVKAAYRLVPNHNSKWMPVSRLEKKGKWKGIVIHHSAVAYGNAAHEDKYHKSLDWDGLGYHFVINNGIYRKGYGNPDGLVEVGYRWRRQEKGAHCRIHGDHTNYWNEHTIGICLIGDFDKSRPTQTQWNSLVKVVRFLQSRYNIPTKNIRGHGDVKPTNCPGRGLSVSELKRRLSWGK